MFDEVITIVDYSLYVTTGQTLALAWELPHRPIVLENMFFDQLPPPAPVVESVDVQQQRPLPPQAPRPPQPLPPYYKQPYRRVDSYYYGNKRPLWQPSSSSSSSSLLSPFTSSYVNKGAANLNAFSDYNRPPTTTTTEYPTTTAKRDSDRPHDIIINDNFPFIGKRNMAVLALGKRNAAADEATDDILQPKPPSPSESWAQRQHHRQSRYDLYRLIEVYLTA